MRKETAGESDVLDDKDALATLAALYRSSVVKKVTMAVSGFILFLFVFGHMVGNLKVFEGPESFDAYAGFLREVGTPLVPEQGLLWGARLVLLAAVAAHLIAAAQLWTQSRAARRHGYRKESSLVFSYASRTMRWGGVIVLAFVVYHLLHLTFGTVHPDPDFDHASVYHNVVLGFQSWPVSGFYILANAALALHIYHGLWSATQTLGAVHPRYERLRRPLALAVALVIFIGYISIPVAVLAGFLTLGT